MLLVALRQQTLFLSFPQRLFNLMPPFHVGRWLGLIYLGKYVQPGQVYWKWQSGIPFKPSGEGGKYSSLTFPVTAKFILTQRPHHMTIFFYSGSGAGIWQGSLRLPCLSSSMQNVEEMRYGRVVCSRLFRGSPRKASSILP